MSMRTWPTMRLTWRSYRSTRPHPRFGLAAAWAATGLLLSSCSAIGSADLPPSPTSVDVTMRDFRYDFDQRAIHRGRVVFRVTNQGPLFHQLALIPIPENLPPIVEQVRGGNRATVTERVGTPPLRAGASDVFAADLHPGRWAFVCFFIGPEGSHASKGMAAEFRVT